MYFNDNIDPHHTRDETNYGNAIAIIQSYANLTLIIRKQDVLYSHETHGS